MLLDTPMLILQHCTEGFLFRTGAKSYGNKGYATEAVDELILWARSSGNVARITAETKRGNESSNRVLEKIKTGKIAEDHKRVFWELDFLTEQR